MNIVVPLLISLGVTWDLKATEPRDKVFAMLGLKERDMLRGMGADYRDTIKDVYTKITLGSFMAPSATIFSLAGIGYERVTPDLYSWVPDFLAPKIPSHPFGLKEYADGAEYDAFGMVEHDGENLIYGFDNLWLMVSAVKVDVISDLSGVVDFECQYRNGDPPRDLKALGHIQKDEFLLQVDDLFSRSKYASETDSDAKWRSIIADRSLDHPDRGPVPPYFSTYYEEMRADHEPVPPEGSSTDDPDSEVYYDALRRIVAAEQQEESHHVRVATSEDTETEHMFEDDSLSSGHWKYGREMMMTTRGRRYCLTEGGDVGIVPPLTLPGDIVSVVQNARVPFLIRPTEIKNRYLLVGECYIHGLMRLKGKGLGKYENTYLV